MLKMTVKRYMNCFIIVIKLLILTLQITVYIAEAFHLQHRPDVRRSVCMVSVF